MDLALPQRVGGAVSSTPRVSAIARLECTWPRVDLALSQRVGGAVPPAHLHAADGQDAGGEH